MPERTRLAILAVEDSEADCKLIAHELRRAGHDVRIERVEDEAGMLAALDRGPWDVVLSDWSLPRFSGERALAIVKQRALDIPFIIVTGTADEAVTVAAMRAGAHDYVLKDRLARLAPAVERELRDHAVRCARRKAEQALGESERQLRQAQKMEAIAMLAGGIAHDFNNLLTVIISYSSVLLDELPPEHPIRADLEAIHDAGRRSADLTTRLLAFSRTQVLEPVELDLNRAVCGVEKLLRRLLGADIELRISCAPELGPITFDPVQLEQVIMNLAVNARDAMPHGGQLTIETSQRELSADAEGNPLGLPPGPYVVLSVADTGIGMDEATQQRAFEPFFTTKGPERGTGLGLSTVFGIVRQSGGAIALHSAPQRGTRFEIVVPRATRHGSTDGDARVVNGAAGREAHGTALLVEDDEVVRQVIGVLLTRLGYQVLSAGSCEQALLLCRTASARIDLLVTDLILGPVNGRDLSASIRELAPQVAVLYMTGNVGTQVARDVLEAGEPLMLKPVTPESLARHLHAIEARPGALGAYPHHAHQQGS